MKDQLIINVPVYKTKTRVDNQSLFPASAQLMIKNLVDKLNNFNSSVKERIIVDPKMRNYTLEVKQISASSCNYNGSDLVLVKMNVVKSNLGEEYIEISPAEQIKMNDSIKMGSNTYFFLMYPVVIECEKEKEIQYYWNIYIYDDSSKDSEDFLRVVKEVLKTVFGENIRNLKYKEFLDEIMRFNVLDNIEVSITTIEDIDGDLKMKYGTWLSKSSLNKKRLLSFSKFPSDRFEELFNTENAELVEISKKIFKITKGIKQYVLRNEFKKDAKEMRGKSILTLESCFNDHIFIQESEKDKMFDEQFIIKKIGPIISKYLS